MKTIRIILILLFLFGKINSQLKEDLSPTNQISDTIYKSTKSPTFAMLTSAAVPGLGQIYNNSWWKVPVIWGFAYYFGKIVVDQNDHYKYWKNMYDESSQKNSLYRYNRDFYHDQRDQFAWYLAITYALNIVDAYVDASLYNFEVTPQLSNPNSIQVTLKIKIR